MEPAYQWLVWIALGVWFPRDHPSVGTVVEETYDLSALRAADEENRRDLDV